MFSLHEAMIIRPEIFTLIMACVVLITSLYTKHTKIPVSYFLTQVTLIVLAFLSVNQLGEPREVILNGAVVFDMLATVLKLGIYIGSFCVFLYSRSYIKEVGLPQGEYYVLGLLAILGMMVLVSAGSFLTLYLGLEILSLALYTMIAMQRDSALALEASMKYFILGALASGILLFGLSLLYGATGTLDITQFATIIAQPNFAHHHTLVVGLVFVVIGIAFKFGVAPFHMWVPDVYHGAPACVTLFLGTVPELAAFGMTVRLLHDALPSLLHDSQQMLMILSILSMGIGNLLAIAQTNLRRMFAYSAIGQMGYVFLGFLVGNADGYAAALYYVAVYALMSLVSWGMIVVLSHPEREIQNIDDLRGLNAENPWLAFLMLLTLFSLAGVPPTVGFFAKLGLLRALVNADFAWLAALALGFSVMAAYYYIRVVKAMYFDTPAAKKLKPAIGHYDVGLVLSINGILLLVLGIFPDKLWLLCHALFRL